MSTLPRTDRTTPSLNEAASAAARADAGGYRHEAYARSLREFGSPRLLPSSGGWILERAIDGSERSDAIGCYPLFACQNWAGLADDLKTLEGSLVSLMIVADPFGDALPEQLSACFPNLCRPFKAHYVADLSRDPRTFVNEHHRRNARKGQEQVSVEECEPTPAALDDWTRLYDALIERHDIRGMARFSPLSFREQFATPGFWALRATRDGCTVGMVLWYVCGDVAYYHLGAYDDDGYARRASFAIFWRAMELLAARGVRWLNLGGAAGLSADADDGLARFKAGWSCETRTSVICGRILDAAAYEKLAASQPVANNNFFPAYRAGL